MIKNKKKYSKTKGKNGERELAKILEEYFLSKFIRVPNSGAYIGGKNIIREKKLEDNQIKILKGDIITPEILNNIIFECKFYKNFPLRNCLRENFSLLESWIDQIETVVSKEIWFLCIKSNNQGWIILFEDNLSKNFLIKNYLKYNSKIKNKNYILCDLKIFLSDNKNKIISLSSCFN